jgi:hypothetical protein
LIGINIPTRHPLDVAVRGASRGAGR